MKNKLIAAAVLSLAFGFSVLASGFPPLEAWDMNGTDPAKLTVQLMTPNRLASELPEREWNSLLRSRTLELPVRIPQFALGAIENSRLDKALEGQLMKATDGINVRFKLADFRAGFDVVRLEVKLESGLKRGSYPMVMNLTNPLTKQQGSIAFTIEIRP